MWKYRAYTIVLCLLGLAGAIKAQSKTKLFGNYNTDFHEKQGGNFSSGMRNTVSLFNDGVKGSVGTGIGGHFRIQLSNRINTEWFADVFMSNLKDKAHRTDYHIGWSVLYYVLDPKGFERKFTPYIIAGHCFDETDIAVNGSGNSRNNRFTSEVQTGIGCQYNITPRFNLSLSSQYGFHLGKEVELEENRTTGDLLVVKHDNSSWEGHLMFSLSANYKLCKLWNRG